jgi:O-antigen ligase
MGTSTIRFGENAFPHSRRDLAQSSARIYVIALLCFSVLAPSISLSPSLPLVKAEQLLLPVIFAVYGWFLLAGFARPIRPNGMFLIGALYSMCVIFSTVYGSVVLQQQVILRDFYEIPKLWLPVFFFTVAYEAQLSEASLRRLLNFLALALLFVCFYAWGQWAGLGATDRLNAYYSAGQHVEGSLQYGRRVYSTMGNPNVLGQLMTWSMAAFTIAALFRVGSTAQNIFVSLACLVTLGMTGSRYALITATLSILLILAMPLPRTRRGGPGKLVFAIPLLLVFGWTIATVATSNRTTLNRVESLRNPLQTDSARQRLDSLWRDAGDEIIRSPLLGRGPAKTIFTGIITDSEYLDVVKEFGLIGFLPYIAYFVFPLYLVWTGFRAVKRSPIELEERLPATLLVLRLSFVMAVTAIVMNVGMSTFYNQLLQGFLWVWLGLGARAAKSIANASAGKLAESNNLEFADYRGALR